MTITDQYRVGRELRVRLYNPFCVRYVELSRNLFRRRRPRSPVCVSFAIRSWTLEKTGPLTPTTVDVPRDGRTVFTRVWTTFTDGLTTWTGEVAAASVNVRTAKSDGVVV